MKLKGKVAIVTGSGRGVGKAIAIRFAREGAKVVICSRTGKEIEETAEEIRKLGGEVLSLTSDISKEADVENLVGRGVTELGTVDILVNNAGVLGAALIDEMEESLWDQVIDVNLKGVFLCTKHCLRVMKPNRSGKVITISSDSGKMGTSRVSAYCSSKFGVQGFIDSLAKEVLEYNIGVSAILPGWINTGMRLEFYSEEDTEKGIPPKSEWLQPEQVAEVAVFLATLPESVHIQEIVMIPTKEVLFLKPILDEI